MISLYCRLFTTNEEEGKKDEKLSKEINEWKDNDMFQTTSDGDLQLRVKFWPPENKPILRQLIFPSRESNSDRNKLTKQIAR